MKKTETLPIDFGDEWESVDDQLYKSVRNILENARKKAFAAVNTAMVEAYWHVGKEIVDLQGGAERAAYGDGMIKKLSKRLTAEWGTGFRITNLKNMRTFYLVFQKGHTVCDQLNWSHCRLIMRVENERARNYYIEECRGENWSVRQLERQINSFSYERILSSHDECTVPDGIVKKEPVKTARDFVKDPFVLEFLGLPPNKRHNEAELEQGLIDHMQKVLLELGREYTFKARQKRISINGSNYYMDLLFYNQALKCYVIVELKTRKLTHKDLGQMRMYLNYFTQELMKEGDSPPMGIIICADKDESVVRYALPEGEDGRIFASRYKLCLPTEEELAREIAAKREQLMLERFLSAEGPNIKDAELIEPTEHPAVPNYRTFPSLMSEEGLKRFKKEAERLSNDPKARRELFTRIGVYDENGNVTERFRDLFEEKHPSD